MSELGFSEADLATTDMVFQLGLPPRRSDLTTGIHGVTFDEAWPRRESVRLGELDVPYLDRESLLRNMRAAGRPKDLGDIALLEEREE